MTAMGLPGWKARALALHLHAALGAGAVVAWSLSFLSHGICILPFSQPTTLNIKTAAAASNALRMDTSQERSHHCDLVGHATIARSRGQSFRRDCASAYF